jgi:hypothetical protein
MKRNARNEQLKTHNYRPIDLAQAVLQCPELEKALKKSSYKEKMMMEYPRHALFQVQCLVRSENRKLLQTRIKEEIQIQITQCRRMTRKSLSLSSIMRNNFKFAIRFVMSLQDSLIYFVGARGSTLVEQQHDFQTFC